MTRSSCSAFWNSLSPRMTSRTTETPSSGTRRRTAPVPSSAPRKPWLPCASRHALTSSALALERYAWPPSMSRRTTSAWRSARSDWRTVSPSWSIPSQSSASRICSTFSGVERSRSVSSMRSTISPPCPRASSQLKRAVRAPPMCRAPVGDGAKRTRIRPGQYPAAPMLIGAHVSNAGGLPKAVERGLERDCDAVQIFNQSPRMWKPTAYSDEDFAAFNEAREGTRIASVLIHAVYLVNCASEDPELTRKSLTSLTHSLRVGDAIGADGVVLHAGSALKGDVGEAITRAGAVIRQALEATDHCPLQLENTAGAGGTLGRSFGELAGLLEA